MRKEQLLERLEEQSSTPKNDPVIAKMRGLARDIFTYYGIDEFDYKGELQALSHWLVNNVNYDKGASLVKQSVQLSGNKEDDSQIILGSFALALGNPIKVAEKNGAAKVVQYVPNDFASKSGMSGFGGLGEWIVLELSGNGNDYNSKNSISKPIVLTRDIGTTQEILEHGIGGIKTTALRMKQLTQEYLNHKDSRFVEGREKVEKWAENILKKRNINDRSKYLGTLAKELSDPRILRYEKDPLKIDGGQLGSHEWLQTCDRSLSSGLGDCDDFSICIGTLAGLMGMGVTYRVAKCDPRKKNNYTHVYGIIHYPDGEMDGFVNDKNVVVDVVYMKRLKGSGYGREPKGFGVADIRVL